MFKKIINMQALIILLFGNNYFVLNKGNICTNKENNKIDLISKVFKFKQFLMTMFMYLINPYNVNIIYILYINNYIANKYN